ncbi:amidohydrolase family protein [Brevundimonas sp. P7753]|uniref:amidohydrolase family protein n=1 Tax=Brevundimonas sp. P7753 TaxID=2726982 RepID=UPI0015BDFE0D|nr:amidohydrolase family protein [Brevundimonas sp. P7753]NWE53794.1 amidohydrolase family protein [Brevundimonas sp. P7753]
MRLNLAAVLAASTMMLASAPAMAEPVATDHHVHVHSPAILDFLPAYCSSLGRISACPEVFTRPLTVDDLLTDMDAAGVSRALLMSTAYLAESPMMVPARHDAPDLIRAANDFTVDLARRHPDRLSAFVSVNPLTPTALPEIARWADDPFAAGVKLHLTNSDVDLRDPDDVAALARVFRAAAAGEMTIMIHMRTRAEDYGAKDVGIFLDQVLPQAQGVPVMIAHSGGWGGLDDNTWAAMTAFAEALEEHPETSRSLSFDLAQVFDAETSEADLLRLVALMRRIGIDRFVAGSDWPFSGPLNAYLNNVFARLPLTPAEAELIRSARL